MQVFMTKYIKIQAHWNVWRVAAILSVRSEETEAQKEKKALTRARKPWFPTAGFSQSCNQGSDEKLPCFLLIPVLRINKQEREAFVNC